MADIGWRAGPLLVISARLRTALPWYSSWHARNYETKRQGGRWRAEAKAFHELYSRVNPRTVLDCPVGTGRWIETYEKHGASVLGIDLSRHMLGEAQKKVLPGAEIRLEQGDLLNPSRAQELGSGHDLVVCTRFVHWLRAQDLPILIGNLSATGSRHMIIGARVTPDRPARQHRPANDGLRHVLKRIRGLLFRNVVSHVHDEGVFLGALQAGGWTLVDKKLINRTRGSRYFFYLLEANRRPRG